MKLDKQIFELFNRGDFIYRKGDHDIRALFQSKYNVWCEWAKGLLDSNSKLDHIASQSWQNSGHLSKYFWTRLKYSCYKDSPLCISLHIMKDLLTIELSYEFKSIESSNNKDKYNKVLLNNFESWCQENDIDKNLFYICAGKNKFTLEEYLNSDEKKNWFNRTSGIIISVGVCFSRDESEFDNTSNELTEIISKLCALYELIQFQSDNDKISYWLGGAMYDDGGDVSSTFIEKNIFGIEWKYEDISKYLDSKDKIEGFYEKYELDKHPRKMFNLFLSIKKGDKIAIKSTFAKGHTSYLRIKAIGTVLSDVKDGYKFDKKLGHTIPVKWEEIEIKDYDDIGGYWDTIKKVEKKDDIRKIFSHDINVDEKIPDMYTAEQLLEEAYITEDKYLMIVNRLNKKKNIILQGAPGVGKSFLAKRIAFSILGQKDNDKVEMIQFHQSYSYEDFIMGYRPNDNGGFEVHEGVFYKFCKKAMQNPEDKFFFIIDEINRGNLSKIFGELMLLIECDKRGENFAMSTVYNEEKFYIPENVYIIGLMNTADRSIALIDYALRRRFSFIDIEPAFGEQFKKYTNQFEGTKLEDVLEIIKEINNDIENDESLGKGFKIGHSYFCNLTNAGDEELNEIIECDIIPLLEEYWIEDYSKVKNYSQKLHEAVRDE